MFYSGGHPMILPITGWELLRWPLRWGCQCVVSEEATTQVWISKEDRKKPGTEAQDAEKHTKQCQHLYEKIIMFGQVVFYSQVMCLAVRSHVHGRIMGVTFLNLLGERKTTLANFYIRKTEPPAKWKVDWRRNSMKAKPSEVIATDQVRENGGLKQCGNSEIVQKCTLERGI